MQGRVLTIHLIEGTVSGLQTAEIDNWIGKVFVASRADLPSLLQQPEMKGLGAYVLIGDDPNQISRSIIYIGQGSIANRLAQHSSDNTKAFWDNKTLAVVAKDNSLNTADCLYLESRLIELAGSAKSSTLTNGQYPSLPNMAATDKTRVENFLAQIHVLLPVLNINFFTPPPVLPQSVTLTMPITDLVLPIPVIVSQRETAQILSNILLSPRFVLLRSFASAEAELVENSFVVLKGSSFKCDERPSIGKSNSALRSQLKSNGKLVSDPRSGKWIFTENVAFNSPSAAGAVICGYAVSGPEYWKVKDSEQTYGNWDQARINAVDISS